MGITLDKQPQELPAIVGSYCFCSRRNVYCQAGNLIDQFRRQILRYTLGYIREIGIILNPEVNNAALCVGKTNTILGDFFEIRLRAMNRSQRLPIV